MTPLIYNLFKPPHLSSFDVIREVKKVIGGKDKKLGHFGTLDPFACGVLLVGTGGAAKLNDYIHELLPKTYLAVGELGVQTASGDLTDEILQRDEGPYLKANIAHLPVDFMEQTLRQKFLGEYWQAPPQYSAAKFQGKALYEWARAGVEIKKEKKKKHIYDLQIVRYQFPYVVFRSTVSSGTYIRTLFEEMAQHLGTIGALHSLVRESVGHLKLKKANFRHSWKNLNESQGMSPLEALPLSTVYLPPALAKRYCNGVPLDWDDCQALVHMNPQSLRADLFWVMNGEGKILGLAEKTADLLKVAFNFSN